MRFALALLTACSTGPVAPQIVLQVAAQVPGSGVTSDLEVMDLDGSHRQRLTHDDALEFLPHFSPDGTRLAYTKFTSGTYGQPDAVTEAVVYDFGTERETFLTQRGNAFDPVWSPDGGTIAFLTRTDGTTTLWLMGADGSGQRDIVSSRGTDDDAEWGDLAWSSDDWLLFTVVQRNCFKVRIDKMRRDGRDRRRVTDGGPFCTPPGFEQSGDADPAFSPDGQTIFTSRGLPRPPLGGPPGTTERKLVAVTDRGETDLSEPEEPDCIEGVPKAARDGKRLLVFRACFDRPFMNGVYLTDVSGASRTFITTGFGADWNPVGQ